MRETKTRVEKLRLNKETLRRIEAGNTHWIPPHTLTNCYPCPTTVYPPDP